MGRRARPDAGRPVVPDTQRPPADPSNWGRALKWACEAVERAPIRVYDLRHTCATSWLRAGVPLGEVARRLGHSVETLVTVYVGALDGDDEAANRIIDTAAGEGRQWMLDPANQARSARARRANHSQRRVNGRNDG
ncbi:MAG TPA: tyrosine-type recombinase/integrase [Acidimicrobiales bacterium]